MDEPGLSWLLAQVPASATITAVAEGYHNVLVQKKIVGLFRYVHGKCESWRSRTWRSVADLTRDYLSKVIEHRELLPSFV